MLLSLFLFQCNLSIPTSNALLIQNATIIDGTGSDRYIASLRIKGNEIIKIGELTSLKTDSIIDGTGMILSLGFIDSHSHHDEDSLRTKEAAISQGITTIIIGQDGDSKQPMKQRFDEFHKSPWSINVGAYSGHNTIRDAVMGDDYKRKASQDEN